MEGFTWGETALGANTPEELNRKGVNVYFAPNITLLERVVNLANGQVVSFTSEQQRPKAGYFAALDSVARYCERSGAALEERDGTAVVTGSIHSTPVAMAVEDLPNTGRPDGGRLRDLRGFATAYDAREYLPDLAAWMSDDQLRQVRIWKAPRFEKGKMYFDLDNPERGAFVATGDEGAIADHTYVCRDEVMEDVWAQLVTWRQPVSADQADAIEAAASRTEPSQAPLTGPPLGD